MRNAAILFLILFFISCSHSISHSISLDIPAVFKEQATMMHVNGAGGNTLSFGNFTSSKIKRGLHVRYPGWSRGFLLENIWLNQFGLQKKENIKKEKGNFSFSLSDGKSTLQVFAKETAFTRSLHYKIGDGNTILKNYDRLQEYNYIFSVLIAPDTLSGSKSWEMLMTDLYERKKDTVNSLFTIRSPDDSGLAINGQDTIFIKTIAIKNAESPDGKTGWLPIKMLSGYELSTVDGVVAVIDIVDHNIWFYNELEASDKLTIAAISSAIFARRVSDVKW